MKSLRERINKRLMFATHRKVVREELDKTIAGFKKRIEKLENGHDPGKFGTCPTAFGLCDGCETKIKELEDVLKALDSESGHLQDKNGTSKEKDK